MTRAVVFKNDGVIPIEAFTQFGINDKPATDNPIGFFGTGLKYAVAVLVREGFTVEVWRGINKYTFYSKTKKFRTKDFDMIRMKIEKRSTLASFFKPSYVELPYSTEYGKTWQLWQVFRELYSNVLDENGTAFVIDSP